MMIRKIAAMLQRKNPKGLDVNCSCTTFVKGNADAHNNTVQKLKRKTLCFAFTIIPSFIRYTIQRKKRKYNRNVKYFLRLFVILIGCTEEKNFVILRERKPVILSYFVHGKCDFDTAFPCQFWKKDGSWQEKMIK